MIKTYKILSLLLSYPNEELQQFLNEVPEELNSEELLNNEEQDEIIRFVNHFKEMPLIEWQAHYVQIFDNSRSASLYLFEHVKGDSKDRGQAMVDLIESYKEQGLQLNTSELPDYLPVFLEFLSELEVDKASELLVPPIDVIYRIYIALREKNIIYRHILNAVISLSAEKPNAEVVQKIIKNQKPLNFDKEYEEEPVDFGSKPFLL